MSIIFIVVSQIFILLLLFIKNQNSLGFNSPGNFTNSLGFNSPGNFTNSLGFSTPGISNGVKRIKEGSRQFNELTYRLRLRLQATHYNQLGLLLFIIYLIYWISVNIDYDSNNWGYQKICHFIGRDFGIDGISLWFVNLTIIILPLIILSNWSNTPAQKVGVYIVITILLSLVLILNFICLDIISFYILFETSLIPLYMIIQVMGSKNKVKASYYILIFTLFSSLFMLLSISLYIYIIGDTDYIYINNIIISLDLQVLIYLGIIIGILVKTPMYPLHTWLPLVHVESPVGLSMILAGIIIKLSIYGIMRLLLINLPEAVIVYNPLIYTISIVTLYYVGIVTFKQIDMKVIVAYSSIVHMSIAILSTFSNNLIGLEGSLVLSVAHGLTSPGLFFLLGGILYDRYHTRLIYYYQGLAEVMPKFSIYLFIFGLFNMGIPLSLNFIGEFLSFNGIYVYSPLLAVLSIISIFITSIYQMKLTTKILYGYKSVYLNITKDINRRELIILNILLVLIIIIGINPEIIMNQISLTTSSLLYQ